jgi:ubiquinone/menaquinone biosynthesis C-methylase UbiE
MTSVSEVWAAGDYPAVAKFITSAADACVRAAGVQPGDHVLDVACGDGNAAIAAARAGGIVTGVDITPELLDAARSVAPDIEWVEGDAQDLPFDDDSFDVVLSTFGSMFAPDHQRTADEIMRVVRPGGRIAIASWTPEGWIGDFFRTVAEHAPPPPGDSPLLWGTEDHVRELFGDVTTERQAVRFEFESARAAAEFYFTNFGPIVMARTRAADEAALLEDLRAVFVRHGADDGPFPGEYLMAVVRT